MSQYPYQSSLEPLTWLSGEWTGMGSGGFPTMEDFQYRDKMIFSFLDDSFSHEPLIHFEEVAWITASNNQTFKHWESGFFKPTADNLIQFYVSHNTGRMEVTYGQFSHVDHVKKSFDITLDSEFLRNDVGIKTALKSSRKLSLTDEVLEYSLSMSTTEVHKMTHHLHARLARVS